MESLKEIFQNIKDRFANPLIFSFVAAWLICNWRISISLIWYDKDQITSEGFRSIYQYIAANFDSKNGFWYPLKCSLAYTILNPIVKNFVRAFYTWASKWGDNWNLNISNGAKIPFTKYIKIKNSFDERSKLLEDIISKENTIQEEYIKVKDQLYTAQSNLLESEDQRIKSESIIRHLTDVTTLNGYWKCRYYDTYADVKGEEDVYIENGKYFTIDAKGIHTQKFAINFFQFFSNGISLAFIKERIDQKEYVWSSGSISVRGKMMPRYSLRYNFNNLKIIKDGFLSGIENGMVEITYEKTEKKI